MLLTKSWYTYKNPQFSVRITVPALEFSSKTVHTGCDGGTGTMERSIALSCGSRGMNAVASEVDTIGDEKPTGERNCGDDWWIEERNSGDDWWTDEWNSGTTGGQTSGTAETTG